MREEKKIKLELKINGNWNEQGIPNFEVLTNKGLKVKWTGIFTP